MNGFCDGFTNATEWQTNVRGQHAMSEPSKRLLCGIRMDCAQAAEMSCVQRLQKIERFRASDLTDQNVAPGELADRQRRAGDGTRWKHSRDPRSILEARVQNRLHVGDFVSTSAGDVFDGDSQISRLERAVGNR